MTPLPNVINEKELQFKNVQFSFNVTSSGIVVDNKTLQYENS